MHVASLNLCTELHKLSGWNDTDLVYYANGGEVSDDVHLRSTVFDKPENLPAYDAGYLLKKLQLAEVVDTHGGITLFDELCASGRRWRAIYRKEIRTSAEEKASDTPEDALALLAIKLFEEKVLTHD